jgi:uncharacterized membrane protein
MQALQNMANWDRIVRAVLGAVLVALMLTGAVTGTWGWVLAVAGAVLLVTAALGFCPLYTLFGIRTLERRVTR